MRDPADGAAQQYRRGPAGQQEPPVEVSGPYQPYGNRTGSPLRARDVGFDRRSEARERSASVGVDGGNP
ncbi:hypothetical protein ABZ348_00645 [Streptomyces sp. NPDC005963]|uniref:hypothetical protein n=1 Tax=Streptomyces sp. NPDC005963 TaxID=3156721 RepID=UPI0033D1861E